MDKKSHLFYADRDCFAVDIPVFGKSFECFKDEIVAEDGLAEFVGIGAEDFFDLRTAGDGNGDVVGDNKVRFLTHGLYLGDHFADEAFGNQFGRQVRVESDGDAVVGKAEVAFLLLYVDEQGVLGQFFHLCQPVGLLHQNLLKKIPHAAGIAETAYIL